MNYRDSDQIEIDPRSWLNSDGYDKAAEKKQSRRYPYHYLALAVRGAAMPIALSDIHSRL